MSFHRVLMTGQRAVPDRDVVAVGCAQHDTVDLLDELVSEARWFGRVEAIDLLSSSDYSPKREPAIRFLKSGDRDLRWAFELVDPTAGHPLLPLGLTQVGHGQLQPSARGGPPCDHQTTPGSAPGRDWLIRLAADR